ncbi:MAG: hypothetical protein KDD04_07905 [Sinomicrobium sp.]|nr:hypothetical protein [Sinomicrobium sp.]
MTSGIISLKRQHIEFKAGYGLLKQELPGLLQHISLLHAMEKAYFNPLKYDRRKHPEKKC